MKFGIIGAGPIGTTLSHKLQENGHQVKVADVRSIDHLNDKDISGEAVTIEQVGDNIDVLIISIPFSVIPQIKDVVSKLNDEVIIIDTTNYYPFRDDKITVIEEGMPESVWVSEQLGRDVIKAFNNQLAYTLAHMGMSRGNQKRIAMAVAGNDVSQKEIVMNLVDEVGFDAVDNGVLNNSWRQQPGTPSYCTELSKDAMVDELNNANKELAPINRDAVGKHIYPGITHAEIVELNRKTYTVD